MLSENPITSESIKTEKLKTKTKHQINNMLAIQKVKVGQPAVKDTALISTEYEAYIIYKHNLC